MGEFHSKSDSLSREAFLPRPSPPLRCHAPRDRISLLLPSSPLRLYRVKHFSPLRFFVIITASPLTLSKNCILCQVFFLFDDFTQQHKEKIKSLPRPSFGAGNPSIPAAAGRSLPPRGAKLLLTSDLPTTKIAWKYRESFSSIVSKAGVICRFANFMIKTDAHTEQSRIKCTILT